jgi:hypothetical protein
MLQLIAAGLVGGLIGAMLRPFLRLGLLLLGVAAAVELPARLWLAYVDIQASTSTLTTVRWVTGGGLLVLWLRLWVVPALRRGPGRPRQVRVR